MKWTLKVGWMLMVCGGCVAGRCMAGDAPAVAVNADLPIASAYVWRGQVLNDEAVFQPALNLSKGGFGLNVWGNENLTDAVADAGKFSEIDLTASYGGKIGPVQYGFGIIEYLFPNQTLIVESNSVGYPSTREVYVSASLPDLPVVPVLTVYRDVDEGDCFYGSFSLGHSRGITEKMTLGLSASIGFGDRDYNAFYFGVDEAKVNDANVGATLTYQARPNLAITPGIQYAWLPDGDISDAAGALYKDDSALVGSLKANYTF
jgi:hypothetical protein